MEFSWLNTFLTAAQCGNFRKTAELLYISQPSVSVHIKLLEKELGVELFERMGRKVRLTEEGRRYLGHAEKLLEVYQHGLEDMESFRQGYTDKLTVAISPLIADTILPYILRTYFKQHPQVEFSLKILESEDIEQAILNEEADIGLSCLQSFHNELHSEILFQDKVILVSSHDGMDAESGPPLLEEEVLSENYLFTNNHPEYWPELVRSVRKHYPAIRMMEVARVHITKRFIEEGLGVSYLPVSTVRRELMEGRLLEVRSSSIPLPKANTYALMKYRHTMQMEFLHFVGQYRI